MFMFEGVYFQGKIKIEKYMGFYSSFYGDLQYKFVSIFLKFEPPSSKTSRCACVKQK